MQERTGNEKRGALVFVKTSAAALFVVDLDVAIELVRTGKALDAGECSAKKKKIKETGQVAHAYAVTAVHCACKRPLARVRAHVPC